MCSWFILLECLVLTALLSALVTSAPDEIPWTTLTPEEVRFASKRCQNDTAGGNLSLSAKWASRQFPDDHATHCYIKCFLRKLGLIDLHTRGLNSKKLLAIWDNIAIVESCLVNLDLYESLDSRCISYYDKWMQFRSICADLVISTFFEDGGNGDRVFKSVPRSRSIGVSATEFCKVAPDYGNEEYSAEIVTSHHQCELRCIFQHFHFFDLYGRLDESEVMRSFNEANRLTSRNVEAVKQCTHNGNILYNVQPDCKMAAELDNCLRERAEHYPQVYQLRDETSRLY